MSGHTEGELRLIRSNKHPGDVFIKIKGTERMFVCKFYGGNGSEISPSEAEENVCRFALCWNSHDSLTQQRDDLLAALEKIYAMVDYDLLAIDKLHNIKQLAKAAIASVQKAEVKG